ncbi:hypothetical protein [Halorussus sp. GCM10023401]
MMSDIVEARRAFIQELTKRPLVEDVDFSRDGYRTVVLTLGEPGTELTECPCCGAVGLPERIEDHDCQEFREWRADQ